MSSFSDDVTSAGFSALVFDSFDCTERSVTTADVLVDAFTVLQFDVR